MFLFFGTTYHSNSDDGNYQTNTHYPTDTSLDSIIAMKIGFWNIVALGPVNGFEFHEFSQFTWISFIMTDKTSGK